MPLRLQHRRRPRRGNRRSTGSQAQRRKDGGDVVQVLDARHGEVRGGEVLQEPTEVDALEVGRKKPISYIYDMYLIYIYITYDMYSIKGYDSNVDAIYKERDLWTKYRVVTDHVRTSRVISI